ncbi:MAG TPA: pseudouridine synthase [Paenalcaligenes sp.]|nr:pseudouridine synthase [Paenalcaligenes sp.]
MTDLIRVSKLMADRGLCSRREADELIRRQWVKVNGQVVSLGERAQPNATITLHPKAKEQLKQQVTILINKPVGYVSGQAEKNYRPASVLITPDRQFLPPNQRAGSRQRFQRQHLRGLAPAGRLDIDSQGLLVLTQDGQLARRLIGADSTVDKEYLVRVKGRLDKTGLSLLNHGLKLDGQALKPARVRWLNDDQLHFCLREGRKRQIRRMCEQVGLQVLGLKRVRIGRVRLGNLPEGRWRYLQPDERF